MQEPELAPVGPHCRGGRLLSLAATARLANVPSVVSNLWLGMVCGVSAANPAIDARFWKTCATLGVAGICLYLAGNFLNDWADRDWDARHRPERALPRRLFPPDLFLMLAGGLAMAGLLSALAAHPRCLVTAAAIVVCIIVYTRFHKLAAWPVLPLALCRALLPVMGYMAIAGPPPSAALTGAAFGLACHVAGLSLGARFETMPQPPAAAMRPAPGLFLLAALAVFLSGHLGLSLPLPLCAAGLLPYGLWTTLCLTRFRHPISARVSNHLAGIPLLDWILLLPFFLTLRSGAVAMPCLWLPPLAFLAGKALQKPAPAT